MTSYSTRNVPSTLHHAVLIISCFQILTGTETELATTRPDHAAMLLPLAPTSHATRQR